MSEHKTKAVPLPTPEDSGITMEKLMSALSYFGIFVLVPLLVSNKRSLYLNFHVNQGLSLVIVWFIGYVVWGFLHFRFFIPIWQLLTLMMMIFGVVNVIKNEAKALPVIGNLFQFIK